MIFVEILWPLFMIPILVSWLSVKIGGTKIWGYLFTFIAVLVYPLALMSVFHFKDGAANAGLIVITYAFLPICILIQFLANLVFSKFLKKQI